MMYAIASLRIYFIAFGLTLVDGLYEESVFQGTEPIKPVIFPILNITTDLVLASGQV